MFRNLLLVTLFIILSGCGTIYRIMEDPYYNPQKGQSFYNPYNPYYQAVRGDGELALPVCALTIVGCPFIIIDLPISFVVDSVMLPYDLTRGAYITLYNKKHTVLDNYGPFIFKYSHIYKTGNFLDIYYLNLNHPLTSTEKVERFNTPTILSFQSKLLAKTLIPTPRLLIEDRFGAIFLLEVDSNKEINITKVGDHHQTVMLSNDPNIQVFYRKMGDNMFGPACTMFNCGERLSESTPNFYTFDRVINYHDLSIINQYSIKYPDLNCDKEQDTLTDSEHKCIIQYYLLSLSPNQQQAVYLSNTGKLWVLDKEGTFNFITDLNQEQQESLAKLLAENKQKEQRYSILTDKEQLNNYKEDTLTLYKKYIIWFKSHFKWQESTNNHWQILSIK